MIKAVNIQYKTEYWQHRLRSTVRLKRTLPGIQGCHTQDIIAAAFSSCTMSPI